jgi:hypothetical protein
MREKSGIFARGYQSTPKWQWLLLWSASYRGRVDGALGGAGVRSGMD